MDLKTVEAFDAEERLRRAYDLVPSGAVADGCFHKSCKGRDWHAL